MNSARHPSALGSGEWALIQDLRIDDGTFLVRQPTVNITIGGLPTGTPYGSWQGPVDAQTITLVALSVLGSTRIYEAGDGVSFNEVTQPTGAYGNTRLQDGLLVTFQIVRDRLSSRDFVVIQNGTDVPRIYSTSPVNGAKVRIHASLAAPTWATTAHPVPLLSSTFVTLANGLAKAFTNAANISFSDGAGSNFVVLTLTNAVLNDDNATFVFPVARDLSASNYLVIVSDQASADHWQTMTLALKTTSLALLYPKLVSRTPWIDGRFAGTSATGGLNGEEILVFSLGDLSPGARISIGSLTVFWNGPAPVSTYSVSIHAIAFSGSNPANALFAVANRNSASNAQSAGVVLGPLTTETGSSVASIGGPNIGKGNLPYIPSLNYDYRLPIKGPSSSDLAAGVDRIDVFRKDDGGSDFLLVKSISISIWNDISFPVAWAYRYSDGVTTTAPSLSDFGFQMWTHTSSDLVDVSQTAPDAFSIPIPKGFAMAAANTRLVVGAGSGGIYPNLQTSEPGNPFRFRLAVNLAYGQVGKSASFATLAGESIQAFIPAAASSLGASSIYVFTKRSVYVVSGFDGFSLSQPTQILQTGTLSPFSVQQRRGTIYWLDQTGQVQRLDSGMLNPISRKTVDDRTKAIPAFRLQNALGFVSQDRYYLAYTPNGSPANSRVLVWDEVTGSWQEDRLLTNAEIFMVTGDGSRRMLFFDRIGALFEHEKSGDTSPVSVRLTSREIHQGMWNAISFGRLGIVADVSLGQTVKFTRTYFKSGITELSAVSLSAKSAETRVIRFDQSLGAPPGKTGTSVQIDIQSSLTPGKRIFGLVLETTPRESEADVDTYAISPPSSGAFLGLDFSDAGDSIYLGVI